MKALFLPMDAAGHINTCLGIAKRLHDGGHQVSLTVPSSCDWLANGYDWLEVSYYVDPEHKENEDISRVWGIAIQEESWAYKLDTIDQILPLEVRGRDIFTHFVKKNDETFAKIIADQKPDIIFVDSYVVVPSVVNSGIPWVLIYSANPLRAYCKNQIAPPYASGYSVHDPLDKFKEFKLRRYQVTAQSKESYDNWLKSKGVSVINDIDTELFSPYLNLYSYPAAVDYKELGALPDNWLGQDHSVRPLLDKPLGIDENFLKSRNKVVYFSLGSMGSADVDLMKRLLAIMSKSKHKFVVSKGPFHDRIDLYPNMAGDKYINQLKIIPLSDLVICHGGNNTFVEALYYGKPMIAMPLFADQHDNARRLEDLKIGRCLYPYKVEENELLGAIDDLLTDEELRKKMISIGEDIRNSNNSPDLLKKLKKITEKSCNFGCSKVGY